MIVIQLQMWIRSSMYLFWEMRKFDWISILFYSVITDCMINTKLPWFEDLFGDLLGNNTPPDLPRRKWKNEGWQGVEQTNSHSSRRQKTQDLHSLFFILVDMTQLHLFPCWYRNTQQLPNLTKQKDSPDNSINIVELPLSIFLSSTSGLKMFLHSSWFAILAYSFTIRISLHFQMRHLVGGQLPAFSVNTSSSIYCTV